MAAETPDPLAQYRAKRTASASPEPSARGTLPAGRRFVVQHHAARALHYDLRLEIDGVLRSWAVPKGPSPDPADKRLAVHVEDHPLEYANFEGKIPEGNYGAGAVIVWDRGSWQPLGGIEDGWTRGKLLFDLRGYKLRGRWTLIRTKRSDKDWLLIKERDGYVDERGIDAYPADSILSGSTVVELRDDIDRGAPITRRLTELSCPQRGFDAGKTKVMLASPGEPFSRAGWLFEFKYDGYRLLVDKQSETVRLWSRNHLDLTKVFPEITEAVSRLPFERLVMDAEAVVHDERGLPSFKLLQKRGRLTRSRDIEQATVALPAVLYVFDLLAFEAFDLRGLALADRKAVLREVLPSVGPLRYSDHIEVHGERLFEQAGRLGVEGMIAKRADAPYRGGRTRAWLKIVGERRDDFVVLGYTESDSPGLAFGALLLGQYDDGRLRYAGRAGSGFGVEQRGEIRARLDALGGGDAPDEPPTDVDPRWRAAKLVCEVKYKERTGDGLLRAPVFMGLRDDKEPEECRYDAALPELPAVVEESGEHQVLFTNEDKLFWPEDGYTKGDLLRYYEAIAPWLLPYLRDRPVVLDRYPDGIDGKSFFQKDAPVYVPDWIRVERLWSEHTEREIRYFIIDDTAALLYVANMASIPLHVWSSRIGSLEKPDWCILDLDPKEAPFADVITIARAIHKLCEALAIAHFVKTSGSTGLHVLMPLGRQLTYEQTRMFAELLARVIVKQLPDIATVSRRPSGRQGRVYIDYLQNGHGRLLVAPFSARPLPGAPVSMPLRWPEVNKRLDISRFTIDTAPRRLAKLKQDPLRPLLEQTIDVADALQRLTDMLQA